MNIEGLKKYRTSYLVLIAVFLIQLSLVFFDIYNTRGLTMEGFTIVTIQLIVILLSCFGRMLPIATFSIIYILGYIGGVIYSQKYTTIICYTLMLFVPLSIIYSKSINKSKEDTKKDLINLN